MPWLEARDRRVRARVKEADAAFKEEVEALASFFYASDPAETFRRNKRNGRLARRLESTGLVYARRRFWRTLRQEAQALAEARVRDGDVMNPRSVEVMRKGERAEELLRRREAHRGEPF